MQVASVDTVTGTGGGKENVKPSVAASDAFAILLQNALTQSSNTKQLQGAGGTELAKLLSSSSDSAQDAPAPRPAADKPDDTPKPKAADDRKDPAPADNDKHAAAKDKAKDDFSDDAAALAAATQVPPSVSRATTGASGGDAQAKQALAQAASNAAKGSDEAAKAAAKAAAQTGNTGNAAGQDRIGAQVTDQSKSLVSRPNSTLTASATVSAQSGTADSAKNVVASTASAGQSDAVGTATRKSAEAASGTAGSNGSTQGHSSDSSGNLLLNAQGNKPAGQVTSHPGAATSQAANTPQAPNPAQAGTVPPANGAPVPPQAASQAAASAAAKDVPETAATPRVAATSTADTAQPAGNVAQTATPSSTATARTSAPTPPRPTQAPPDLHEQISVQVQKAVNEGADKIRIQLKPAELGRLEIQLHVAKDGKVAALVHADRPETLDLLRRDARELQQVLQNAGLQVDSNSLSFNLGGGGNFSGQAFADNAPTPGAATGTETAAAGDTIDTDTGGAHRRSSNSTIDVEV